MLKELLTVKDFAGIITISDFEDANGDFLDLPSLQLGLDLALNGVFPFLELLNVRLVLPKVDDLLKQRVVQMCSRGLNCM